MEEALENPFAHGSLAMLAPSWWEPEDGSEPEPWITADDALMLRAELNEQQLGRPQTARECYEKLLIDYPTSLYADQARKRYNALKKNE